MKKVYGIVGILALLLVGCSQDDQEVPDQEPAAVEPAEEPEDSEPEPAEFSEVDQYLHDVRNPMEFGEFVLNPYPYTGVSDSDLLRAAYAFCDYVDGFGEDVDYRMAVTFSSVLDFPESVSQAEDGNNIKVAASAVGNLCPNHADPFHDWMINFD